MFILLVFFFKQKTAYEMRISDWSSDVCSSDLNSLFPATRQQKYCDHGRSVVLLTTTCPIPFARSSCGSGGKPRYARSEERRVGKECVSTCRSRWSQYH